MLIFSWCSEIKVTPTNVFQDILVEAFRRLPQRVVWKYEGDDLQLPPNVLPMDWVPQQDLLGELVAKAKSHMEFIQWKKRSDQYSTCIIQFCILFAEH